MLFPSYSGTLWWYSNKSRIYETHTFSIRLEKSNFITEEVNGFFSLFWGVEKFQQKKGGQSSSSCLSDSTESGKDLEEEKPHSDYTVAQKAPYETKWKRNQCAVFRVRLKEAQNQGLEFWQTKSFAVMTYFTIPGDCIDSVTVQDGDRVLFERLATPRPAPKVTLKRNWQSQQQQQQQQPQQPISHTDPWCRYSTSLTVLSHVFCPHLPLHRPDLHNPQRPWQGVAETSQAHPLAGVGLAEWLIQLQAHEVTLWKMIQAPTLYSQNQMTAAQVMDVIARQPDCDGQATDAVSAYTQAKMEDAPRLLRIPKSQCPDFLDTSSTTLMAEVSGRHWRSSGSSWTKFIRTPTRWTIVGKTVRGSSVGTWMGKSTDCLYIIYIIKCRS